MKEFSQSYKDKFWIIVPLHGPNCHQVMQLDCHELYVKYVKIRIFACARNFGLRDLARRKFSPLHSTSPNRHRRASRCLHNFEKPLCKREAMKENTVSYTCCWFTNVAYVVDGFDCKDIRTKCSHHSMVVLRPIHFSESPEKQGNNQKQWERQMIE